MNKAYYRLHELEFHHKITKDEIRYFVEKDKLQLSFVIKNAKLLIGRANPTEFEFVGHGKLSGVFSASNEHSAVLFTKTKIKTKTIEIRKLNSGTYSHNYPFAIEAPNSEISKCSPKKLEDLKDKTYLVKNYPRLQPSSAAVGVAFFDMLKSFGDSNDKIENPFSKKLEQGNAQELYCDEFTLNFSDACILHDDLVALSLIGLNKPHSERFKVEKVEPKVKPNRLNEEKLTDYYTRGSKTKRIVSNLIGYAPNKSASELWLILRKAVNDDALTDLIDPESDILEVTRDKILWNVPDEEHARQKQVTKRTFNNVVTEMKKDFSRKPSRD
ncbi:hypothetical protein ACI7YQ_00585 [Alteromonas marina]